MRGYKRDCEMETKKVSLIFSVTDIKRNVFNTEIQFLKEFADNGPS